MRLFAALAPFSIALLALGPWTHASAPGTDDLGTRLSELRDARAAVRGAAERWIAAHARRDDFADLAAALTSGEVEVRERVVRALASSDRHLGLAALMLADHDRGLQEAGRRIVRRRAAGVNPDLGNPGVAGPALAERFQTLSERSLPIGLSFTPAPTLGETVTRLSLRGRVPLALWIDPTVAALPARDEALRRGTWSDLLVGFSLLYGVGLEVHGFDLADEEDIAGGFLALVPRAQVGRRPGDQLLAEAFETLVRSTEAPRRTRAARNLAGAGWAGVLSWMAERVEEESDPACLEGLLWAAARGRRARLLTEPPRVAALVDSAAAALDRGDPGAELHAELLVEAFEGNGLAPEGASLGPLLVGDPGPSDSPGRGLRLALALASGVRDASVRRLAAQTLGLARVNPVHLALALQLDLAVGGGTSEMAAPQALLFAPRDPQDALRLAAILEQSEVQVPELWRDPARLPPETPPAGRLLVIEHWLRRGEPEVAARHLRGLIGGRTDPERAVRAAVRALEPLRRFRGGAGLSELFRVARRGGTAEEAALLEHLAVALDLVGTGETQAFLEVRKEEVGLDWRLMGILAGRGDTPEARQARRLLEAELARQADRGADPRRLEPLIEALETAVERLFERREDELALVFADRIAAFARRSPALNQALRQRDFPAAPRAEDVDLDRPRRRFPAGG